MHFEFATATRILFGPGTIKELASAATLLGRRPLFVEGASGERTVAPIAGLTTAGLTVTEFHVTSEPTVESVLAGVEQARSSGCDMVIGMGGGSVMDTAKAVSVLLTNPGDIYEYLEVVGKGSPLRESAAPCIAIPTTAGTGTEVTRNAVLAVKDRGVKVSLRSPTMLPRLALIDPELTYGLPPHVTATSGLDALTQLIEPFLSNAANPMIDAVCRDGIRRVARSLRRAYETDDHAAREDMSLAALFGGIALANARLGAAHGFAGPIGGMFPAPHGAICARLLPLVMETNLHAIQDRTPDNLVLSRFTEVSRLLTGNPDALAEDGIRWLHALCADLKIPPLSAYGVTTGDFPAIIAASKNSSSMKGNPIVLTDEELTAILERAT
ncbi:MAG TPA: iron-containing alcohol dehydrogenase [Anaerolineales bacterium]